MHEYIKGALPGYQINELVEKIPWQTIRWGKTGKTLPRLAYSCKASELCSKVPEIAPDAYYVLEKYGKISSVWMNLYRDGNDHTPMHQDSYGCKVVTLSYGATRRFQTKNKQTGKSCFYDLSAGDVFVFDAEFNSQHTHSINKTKKSVGPRVSIVFFVQN